MGYIQGHMSALLDAFPGSTWEPEPRGYHADVVDVMARARRHGGLDRWDLPPALATYLEEHAEVVTIQERAERDGFTLCPCSTCGEVLVRKRSAPAVGCRMTPGCKGRHAKGGGG